MRDLTTRLVRFCVVACLGASGCTVSPPTPPTFGQQTPDGGTTQPITGGNPSPDMTDPSFAAPPTLDPVPQTSVYDTVPVHGAATPNTSVLIVSSGGQTVAAQVDVTGRFCADLPLVADTENTFQVADVNLDGAQSTPVSLSVRQAGQPEQQPVQDQSTNAALGGTAATNHIGYFSDGSTTSINDGDPTTAYEGHINEFFSTSAARASIVVALSSKQRISSVVALAPSDCPFTAAVKLYYSAADAPSAPDSASVAGWSELPLDASNGTGTVSATFTSVIASTVAIVWPVPDGSATQYNCGGSVEGPEYGVAELQAWTAVGVAPPAPSAPTCAGGM